MKTYSWLALRFLALSFFQHGLSIVQDLLNKLSSELDQTAKIHTLEKRNQDLLESETSLKDQNEALRRGNRELMHQLQANTTAVAEKGGITEKEIEDTVQVALLNLQAERKRYDELKVSSQTEK